MLDKLKIVLLVTLFSVLAGACGGSQEGAEGGGDAGGETLQVVATFSILGDMVENVAGDNAETTLLVGPAEDTHTFEASPADSRALVEADLIFENGLEFESWLDDIYESSGSEAERVVVTEDIEPLEAGDPGHEEHADEHGDEPEGEHAGEEPGHTDEHAEEHADEEHADEHGHEHGHEHGEYDPHVWQDPANAVLMVEAIRDGLVEADPENSETYEQNAAEYIQDIEELDATVEERLAAVPEENRKLVTGHQVFTYFAERYGFEVPGTAISSFTTEAADPAAGEIAELADEVREEGIPAIFPERFTTGERVMERIARESGVELAPPLFTDALAREGEEGDTYVGMMRYNAETIAGALGEGR